jgi:uncharacterized protein (TIGR02453 family)
MSFFTKHYFDFFAELEQNNNKAWFDIHRNEYEQYVKNPFKKFTQHILDELAKKDKSIFTNASKCIFRINKDIRFSKDKSPYKLNMAAVFGRGGTKDFRPSNYIHLGHKELFIGGGMYMVDKGQLQAIRQEIFYNETEFSSIVNNKKFKQLYGGLLGEKNKVLPSEYKEFSSSQPYIANKQFYCSAKLTKKEILADNFDKIVLEYFDAIKPLNNFLMNAIGENDN